MSIQARYSGTCGECGERWQPGDMIRATDDSTPWDALTRWRHVSCPDDPVDPSLKPGEKVCESCWLVHPEGACDR